MVRKDGVAGYRDRGEGGGFRNFRKSWWREGAGVNSGNNGEVVLEAVEVDICGGNGVVEGVEERGVEGTEGELGDEVGEIECCV